MCSSGVEPIALVLLVLGCVACDGAPRPDEPNDTISRPMMDRDAPSSIVAVIDPSAERSDQVGVPEGFTAVHSQIVRHDHRRPDVDLCCDVFMLTSEELAGRRDRHLGLVAYMYEPTAPAVPVGYFVFDALPLRTPPTTGSLIDGFADEEELFAYVEAVEPSSLRAVSVAILENPPEPEPPEPGDDSP